MQHHSVIIFHSPNESSERFEVVFGDGFFTGENNCRGAVANSRSVGRGHGTALLEDGRKLRHRFDRGVRTGVFVDVECFRA